jgi:tetratricopeptide (TPR) repeat protein
MDANRLEDRLDIARHYLGIGNAKRALAELDKGGSETLEDEDFWAMRAEALFDLHRWSEAADAARRGLELFAEDVTLLDILAICELELDNEPEAKRMILAALELWPGDPTLLAHHGIILAHFKHLDEAERVLAEAQRIAPESPDVIRARAHVAALDGDSRRATEFADELLRLEPDSEYSHVARGNAELTGIRFKHAVRHYEEAARLNPESPVIREALREARVGAHPLLAPVRQVWRIGRWRAWLGYLALASILAAARLESLRLALGIVWITIVALSWLGPPILRRWYGRKHRV